MPPESGRPSATPVLNGNNGDYWIPRSSKPVAAPNGRAKSGPRLPYMPGLDGLRAVAVLGVLLYHAGEAWLPGGFLGVDVFFVLSGYLITSLLLAEYQQTGKINLKGFWSRRARRLLPPLYVLLVVCLTFAVFVLPDEVAQLRGDATAAFFYVTNWWLIFHHQSYFATVGRPSLFQNLWSLAVEEQFYVFWPVIFCLLVPRLRRGLVAVIVALGAIGSTLLMAFLYHSGSDPSRIYYGTDTRAAELLVGVVLAFVWNPIELRKKRRRGAKPMLGWLDAIGLVAMAVLFGLFRRLGEYDATTYRGGFFTVALVTAVIIAVIAHPRAYLVSSILGWRPIRWIGTRSYAIYLWYWPVFMVTRPHVDVQFGGLPLLALRLGAPILLAELSYRFVETPFRSGSVGRAWRNVRSAPWEAFMKLRPQWMAAASLAAVGVLALIGAVAAAKPPATPAYLRDTSVHYVAPDARSKVLATPSSTEPPPPPPTAESSTAGESPSAGSGIVATPASTPTSAATSPAASPKPSTTAISEPTGSPATVAQATRIPTSTPGKPTTPAPSPTPTPTSAPTPTPTLATQLASSPTVSTIGDSVMLGAKTDLMQSIPNLITIDAVQGLQVETAIGILEKNSQEGLLGKVVVVDLGNNGTFTSSEFDTIMQIVGPARHAYFLTLKVPRDWETSNNDVIESGVRRYPNASLIDWRSASINHPEYFWDDGIHLRPEGATVYTNLILAAISGGH